MIHHADTRLWCLHHIGADEMHPAPDFATAQKWADWANTRFAAHADISRFVVATWPWSGAKHGLWLQKAIDEWTVPRAAEPVGLREAVQRFMADVDDGDRAEAGLNPLMQAHVADFRQALATPARTDDGGVGVSDLIRRLQSALSNEWDTSYFRRGSRGDYVNPEDTEEYFELTETDARRIVAALTGIRSEPPTVDASRLQGIRDAMRAYENVLTFTPAASADFRAGMKGGFNAADNVILGMMNTADRGGERLYEPYPGAFDSMLGKEGDS